METTTNKRKAAATRRKVAARTIAYADMDATACANNPKSDVHNGGNGPTSQRLVYVGIGQYSQTIAADIGKRYSLKDSGKRQRLATWLDSYGYEGK